MDYLYAPWRDEYIKAKKTGCPFCYAYKNQDKDDKLHVLFRGQYSFLIMNKYPYTPGHFMVVPNLHVDGIEKLDTRTWHEMSEFVQKSVEVLKSKFGAKGVNIGMNLGSVAGAGIEEHVHYHIVPRWQKDTNFITSIANTRVYSTDFEKIFKKLKSTIQEKFYIYENKC